MVAEPEGPRTLRFVVGEAEAGTRVDQYLVACSSELSRSQVKRLLDDGLVPVDGVALSKTSRKLRVGEVVEPQDAVGVHDVVVVEGHVGRADRRAAQAGVVC